MSISKLLDYLFATIVILVIGSVIWFMLLFILFATGDTKNLAEANYEPLATVQGSALLPISPMPFNEPVVLGALMERIIFCESSNNHTAKNSKSSAYGYCQFIDSTWAYVQKKWGITLNRHNPDDQLYACQRLLEEEGWEHWQASRDCWNKQND